LTRQHLKLAGAGISSVQSRGLLHCITVAVSTLTSTVALALMLTLISAAGISSVQTSGLLDRITGAWDSPAKPLAREGAMLAFAALVKQLGEAGEPYLLPLMPKLLERYADKVRLLGLGLG